MTKLSGELKVYRKDRLFEPIHKIALVVDAVMTAYGYAVSRSISAKPGDFHGIGASSFNLEVCLPALSPFLFVARNEEPDFIFIRIDHNPSKPPPGTEVFTAKLNKIFLGLVTPIYVDFFEQHRVWIRRRFGGDANAWPPLLNFARLIRNFISHHQGRVHFDNPAAPPVSWHHISYSPKDQGRLAVGYGGDMIKGDIIILLIEIGHELDLLGCPNPL